MPIFFLKGHRNLQCVIQMLKLRRYVSRLVDPIYNFMLIISFTLYNRLIKMSSPRLNNLIVIGCIMTYLSVLLFGLDGRLVPSSKYGHICVVRTTAIDLCHGTAALLKFDQTNK